MSSPQTSIPPWPQYDDSDLQAVTEVIKSHQWWSGPADSAQGKCLFTFQDEFKAFCEARHAFGCCNGTVAVEIALRALDVGVGDEVIVSNVTFVASASAVVAVGAVPIFCDADKDTFNIDHTKLQQLITPRTRAIVVVHLGGLPAPIEEICSIAKRHNLKVVEDCAQAHHVRYKGKLVGNFGDIGTFSFNASKTLASGEGGAVITNRDELAEKIYSYIDNGRTLNDSAEGQVFGSDLRMPELSGALLLRQLPKFQKQQQHRINNAEYFRQLLNDIDGIRCQTKLDGTEEPGFYALMFQMDPSKFSNKTAKDLVKYLSDKGYLVSPCATPCHQLGMFKAGHLMKGVDYSHANWGGQKSDDKNFPVSSFLASYAAQFPHQMLLGPQSLLENLSYDIKQFKNLQQQAPRSQ